MPRPSFIPSLKWWLLVAAALLPFAILGLYAYFVAAQSVRRLVDENNRSAAAISALLIDRELERSISFAQTLTALPGTIEMVEAHNEDAVRSRLKAVVESNTGLDRASMTGVDGVMWSDFPRAPETLGRNVSDREWFQGISRAWQPYVSGVYRRLSDVRPLVVVVAAPVKKNGRTMGVMAFHYRLEGISQWLREIEVGENGHVIVLDPAGLVAVHPELDLQAREYSEYASLAAVKAAFAGNAVSTRYIDPFSQREVAASIQPKLVAGRTWVTISQQPVEEAYAPISHLRWQIAIAAVIAALLGVATVVGLGKISQRFRRLSCELSARNHELTQLSHIIQSSNDAILSTTTAGIITSWNPGAERVYGYSAAEALGKPVKMLCPSELLDSQDGLLSRASQGERIVNYEAPRIAKNNRPLTVSISIAPLKAEDGQIQGTTSITRDITEQRRTERELARSNAELEQFAYVASHDLREPLRVITSFSQMLSKRAAAKLDEDEKLYLSQIHDGADRMRNLIQDLLEYSRLKSDSKPFTAVDCNEVVTVARKNLALVFEENNVALEADNLPKVSGDFGQLTRLFQNLIDNAIKFKGASSPRIRISAREQGEQWHFEFQDNGIGIDPQHFKRIFAIFQRLHTREEYPGTGIGLSICKRIVERHGGQIWVDSQPGEGSTFHFTLNRAN